MRTLLFVLITLLMFFLPNRLLTTEPVHEYLGCALLILGGIHLWLERAYLRALFWRRLPMTALNAVNIISPLCVCADSHPSTSTQFTSLPVCCSFSSLAFMSVCMPACCGGLCCAVSRCVSHRRCRESYMSSASF